MWGKFKDNLQSLPKDVQDNLYDRFSNIILEEKLKKVSNDLKPKLIDQYYRIIDIETNKVVRLDTGVFDQPLKKGQIIRVNFVGQGDVLNDWHFCIVWDVHLKAGHVVIIPLTSKKRDSFDKRNIGIIEGLNKRGAEVESLVKVNQIQSISRKSIHIMTKTSEGKTQPVVLSDSQLIAVEDLFRVHYLKEPLLFSVIKERIGVMVPKEMPTEHINALYRPVQFMISEDNLFYRCHDHADTKCIKLIDLSLLAGERKQILKALLSSNRQEKESAEAVIRNKLIAVEEAATGDKSNEK
ncbi:hypothetical protein AM501_28560 [Aneurinibacillus migulanus]|uniref:type II toxin-antitoxin system PemK/MazF family toxin n=1 Tax=Aneurinibacillus migulanus TaxID=47500 RepID=UPI0005BAFCAB|nr:type II toxin-antitoxin system PemK/MazF family toxin [Aneurinibacillus migulanus]KIV58374.1 hypothetical protein TS64_04770 [Aneurinibacillus migulanus]KPD05003.1 hypothetical protein AM501_28560 [Aneurinibacillus migulanus]